MTNKLLNFIHNGVAWHSFSEDIVKEVFADSAKKKIVKKNRMRTVSLINNRFYLKHDNSYGIRSYLKAFFRNKVKNEFDSYLLLRENNIPTVEYIGWGNHGFEGYLLTKAFEGALEVQAAWQMKDTVEQQQIFLHKLTSIICNMIFTNIFHPDLHLGNLLVSQKNKELSFKLVDLYGIKKVVSLSKNQKLQMISCLFPFFQTIASRKLKKTVMEKISKAFSFTSDELYCELLDFQRQKCSEYRKKRRKKFLKNSSLTRVSKLEDGTICRINREFEKIVPFPDSVQIAQSAIEKHLVICKKNPELLVKNDVKRRISRIKTDFGSLIVKQFRHPGPWGRFAPDCRSWLGACGLYQFGINAVCYYVWAKRKSTAFIIMEDLGINNLEHELNKDIYDKGELQEIFRNLGRFLGIMHNFGIYHRDLKLSNFIVNKDNCNITLIDLDDVYFYKKVSKKKMKLNFNRLKENLTDTHKEIFNEVFQREYQSIRGENNTAEKKLR
ncbi:MAG: lipopolysaccharide kinase InaA family protein [Verrucomicrobiota bacterium]|nr:lipopolysaccharide kinase InaA family protein [Verrucomicrobiota bacterium]